MESEIPLQKFAPITRFASSSQLRQIACCHPSASPRKGEGLKFDAQRVELLSSALNCVIRHPANETLALQGDQDLTDHRGADLHLVRKLAFHKRIARLKLAREKRVLQGRGDTVSQRNGWTTVIEAL